jgi:iron(III) transport system ATP-binding protein
MTQVVVKNVTTGYGQTHVLDNVSFEVSDGSMLAVLGASGSGKTTLLRVLAGFKTADSGHIAFGSLTVLAPNIMVPTQLRGVGFVPQEGALFPHLSVEKNVAFGLRGKTKQRVRVQEVLELVGLQALAKKYPHELSGGQAQRVALARALAPQPDVLLLDEPFSALDKSLREELGQEVKAILRALNTTSILVTHDQEEALGLADEVLVLMHGRVMQQGTPQVMYQTPSNVEVGKFLGDLIDLPVWEFSHGSVVCGLGQIKVSNTPIEQGNYVVGFRPEQVILGQGEIYATVLGLRYHGYDTVVSLRLPTGELISARVQAQINLDGGDVVAVSLSGAGRVFLVD